LFDRVIQTSGDSAYSHHTLTEADQALWAQYTRQIAPLPGKTPLPLASPLPPDSGKPVAAKRPVVPSPGRQRRHSAGTLAVGAQPSGLDSGTWNRFRGGKLPVARTLDLHGMTVQRAHAALMAFLRSAHAEQVRVVEIVTGRGSGEAGGAIKRELPFWLNLPEIRPMILGATHPHALNTGSVRLILRRIR
jgi:DNA-nicking Smr family endonuclease